VGSARHKRCSWPIGARQEQWLRAHPQATAAQAATLAPRPPFNAHSSINKWLEKHPRRITKSRQNLMTTSTHSYHGYELVLYHANDDRYHVTIFDPKGNRITSTGTHLERQGALAEASRYVDQLLAQQRTT
jgi:hypothetical protein